MDEKGEAEPLTIDKICGCQSPLSHLIDRLALTLDRDTEVVLQVASDEEAGAGTSLVHVLLRVR